MPTTHSVPGSPAPDRTATDQTAADQIATDYTAADQGRPSAVGPSRLPPQPSGYPYPPPAARPRLRRSDSERMLLGVCGGIAEYPDVDPTLVRLAMIVTLFWGGLGVLLYLIAAIVLPRPATN